MYKITIYGLTPEELNPLKDYLSQKEYVINNEIIGHLPTNSIHGRIGRTELVFPRLIELKVLEPDLEKVLNEYYQQTLQQKS